MVGFIDAHRAEYGVEPICAELQIALSSYYERKAWRQPNRESDPGGALHGGAADAFAARLDLRKRYNNWPAPPLTFHSLHLCLRRILILPSPCSADLC
jgi:hypothetical protein